jgi:hypothetical protein
MEVLAKALFKKEAKCKNPRKNPFYQICIWRVANRLSTIGGDIL